LLANLSAKFFRLLVEPEVYPVSEEKQDVEWRG